MLVSELLVFSVQAKHSSRVWGISGGSDFASNLQYIRFQKSPS